MTKSTPPVPCGLPQLRRDRDSVFSRGPDGPVRTYHVQRAEPAHASRVD